MAEKLQVRTVPGWQYAGMDQKTAVPEVSSPPLEPAPRHDGAYARKETVPERIPRRYRHKGEPDEPTHRREPVNISNRVWRSETGLVRMVAPCDTLAKTIAWMLSRPSPYSGLYKELHDELVKFGSYEVQLNIVWTEVEPKKDEIPLVQAQARVARWRKIFILPNSFINECRAAFSWPPPRRREPYTCFAAPLPSSS